MAAVQDELDTGETYANVESHSALKRFAPSTPFGHADDTHTILSSSSQIAIRMTESPIQAVATGADLPQWEFTKFYVLLGSIAAYAIISAIIAFIWQTTAVLVSSGLQFLLCLGIDFLLFLFYLRGNRTYLLVTNILTGVLLFGLLFTYVYVGYLIGSDSNWADGAHIAEATFLLLAAACSVASLIAHFVFQGNPKGASQYKPTPRNENVEYRPQEPPIQAPVLDPEP
jgi:hypothetical protein